MNGGLISLGRGDADSGTASSLDAAVCLMRNPLRCLAQSFEARNYCLSARIAQRLRPRRHSRRRPPSSGSLTGSPPPLRCGCRLLSLSGPPVANPCAISLGPTSLPLEGHASLAPDLGASEGSALVLAMPGALQRPIMAWSTWLPGSCRTVARHTCRKGTPADPGELSSCPNATQQVVEKLLREAKCGPDSRKLHAVGQQSIGVDQHLAKCGQACSV